MSLITAHGRQTLEFIGGERLIDLLQRNGVPWSAIAAYLVPRGGGPAVLAPCLDARQADLADTAEVLLYFNRNINLFQFSLGALKVVPAVPEAEGAAEYIYQQLDGHEGSARAYLKKLSPEECRQIVRDRVAETMQRIPKGADIVIGVSGGGDSNAMLDALVSLETGSFTHHPVIIKGIPEWDSGVERARAICAGYGLDLRVYEEDDVKDLLGLSGPASLASRFERAFPGDDFEFLGTLLVRLALFRRASEIGTRYVCTGLNLEDVLCESMFRLSNGSKPAGVPVRRIGDFELVLPLWLCPKRIIDGCFPKYSLDNYEERYPCLSLGRNLYYSIIYTMQSQYPGFAEKLAVGLAELAARDPVEYRFDKQLGFHVERFVPFPLRQRFQRLWA